MLLIFACCDLSHSSVFLSGVRPPSLFRSTRAGVILNNCDQVLTGNREQCSSAKVGGLSRTWPRPHPLPLLFPPPPPTPTGKENAWLQFSYSKFPRSEILKELYHNNTKFKYHHVVPPFQNLFLKQFSISFLVPLFMITDFFHWISSIFASILLLMRNEEIESWPKYMYSKSWRHLTFWTKPFDSETSKSGGKS